MGRLGALIFDCDGVIAETERDGHRVSFNRAFREAAIDVEWSVEEYAELVKIAGGKERMRHYFGSRSGKIPNSISDELIQALHKRKTEIYMEMSAGGGLPVRPGIKRLMLEASGRGLPIAVCSTSNERSVSALIKSVLGDELLKMLYIFAGDAVKAKKPAPDIYLLAIEKLRLRPPACVVVEDSRNGLLAAKAAGLRCVVTVSFYSQLEDFSEADLVVNSLGDPGREPVRIIRPEPGTGATPAYIRLEELEKLLI